MDETEEALKVFRRGGAAAKSGGGKEERKEEAEKAIEQAAQSWVLKARLFVLQFKFAEADKAYQEAVQAAPDSYEVNFAYADFNQDLNRYTAARKVYEGCLAMARQRGDDLKIAATLNNLGVLDRDQDRTEEARKEFEECCRPHRELAQKDPETYRHYVAMALCSTWGFLIATSAGRRRHARRNWRRPCRPAVSWRRKYPRRPIGLT